MIQGFALVCLWIGGAMVLGCLPAAFADALRSADDFSRPSMAPMGVQVGWLVAAMGYGFFHHYDQEAPGKR